MRVRFHGSVRSGYEKSARHTEVYDPLGVRSLVVYRLSRWICWTEFADDVLAGAMNGQKGAVF